MISPRVPLATIWITLAVLTGTFREQAAAGESIRDLVDAAAGIELGPGADLPRLLNAVPGMRRLLTRLLTDSQAVLQVHELLKPGRVPPSSVTYALYLLNQATQPPPPAVLASLADHHGESVAGDWAALLHERRLREEQSITEQVRHRSRAGQKRQGPRFESFARLNWIAVDAEFLREMQETIRGRKPDFDAIRAVTPRMRSMSPDALAEILARFPSADPAERLFFVFTFARVFTADGRKGDHETDLDPTSVAIRNILAMLYEQARSNQLTGDERRAVLGRMRSWGLPEQRRYAQSCWKNDDLQPSPDYKPGESSDEPTATTNDAGHNPARSAARPSARRPETQISHSNRSMQASEKASDTRRPASGSKAPGASPRPVGDADEPALPPWASLLLGSLVALVLGTLAWRLSTR